jgi:hypothetical protein
MLSVPSTSSLPICLDLANECLWRGVQAIPLRPKTFAVLRYLLDHPGQLVTKAALLDAVWPAIAVGDGGLMVCMHELRRALGDNPKAPGISRPCPGAAIGSLGTSPSCTICPQCERNYRGRGSWESASLIWPRASTGVCSYEWTPVSPRS